MLETMLFLGYSAAMQFAVMDSNTELETMLFLGYSAATAVNAGKVAFTEKNYGNRKRYLMR